MSATDELRRMLGERGVRWHEATPSKVKWFSPVLNGPVAVSEWRGGLVLDAGYVNVTPEQAIAATLGGEKFYAVKMWSDLDDWGETTIERELYRSKEGAERRAEEVEAQSSDEMHYGAIVVEFEVVE